MHNPRRLLLTMLVLFVSVGPGIWLLIQWQQYMEGRMPPSQFRTALVLGPGFVLPILLLGGAVWFILRPVHSAWRAFARELTLSYSNNWVQGPKIRGEVDGVTLELGTFNTRASARAVVTHTYLDAGFPDCTAHEIAAALNTRAGREAVAGCSCSVQDNTLRLRDMDLISKPEDFRALMAPALAFFDVVARIRARRNSATP